MIVDRCNEGLVGRAEQVGHGRATDRGGQPIEPEEHRVAGIGPVQQDWWIGQGNPSPGVAGWLARVTVVTGVGRFVPLFVVTA